MTKEKDILNYEEFLEKYENDLKNHILSDEIKSNIVDMLLYEKEKRIDNYRKCIKNIYWALIHINLSINSNEKINSNTLSMLINNVLYLNNDFNINYSNNFYNIKGICKEVYNELYILYYVYIEKEMSEEYNYNHITNIYYYIDWIKSKIIDKEILDNLNVLERYL